MRVVDGELAFLHEVNVAEWLGVEAAAERLTYPEVTPVYVHERTRLPDWALGN